MSCICVTVFLMFAAGMLRTLDGAGTLIGKTELLDNLDTGSSFIACKKLNSSLTDLFVFPDEVPFMDNVRVCYYGTNAVELEMDIMDIVAFFIVYQKEESGQYDFIKEFKLEQRVSLSKKNDNCQVIDLANFVNRTTLRFGIYNRDHCGRKSCPMKLYFINNSSRVLHKSVENVAFNKDSDATLQEKLEMDDDSRGCWDLNIRIEMSAKPQSIVVICVTIVASFVFSTLLFAALVVCFRCRPVSKQGILIANRNECFTDYLSTTRSCHGTTITIDNTTTEERHQFVSTQANLAPPADMLGRRISESNNYCGVGPSISNDDKDVNTIHMCDNYTLLTGESLEYPKHLSAEDTHDYEEPYFEPANQEEELMAQIKKFGVTKISSTSNNLRLFKELGFGAFGTVHRGLWIHPRSSAVQQLVEDEVAVKSMDATTCAEERIKFLQEAAIMGQFNHPNIIRILGIVPDDPIMIVIEIMKNGDLRNHILDIKIKSSFGPELPPTLLSYSRQIASGMVYLALKDFVHRDLAARNVLVSDCGTCKIADFGMSRELQETNYYTSHGGKIPVKWTAPEALNFHKYSTASDVWSYGCVLYEIWSLGYKPFHGDTNTETMKKVGIGFRLPPPPGCPKAIYDVMIQCWHPRADQRPSFSDVTVCLQKPDFFLLHWSNEEVNMYGEKDRILGAPLQAGYQLHMNLQKTYLTSREPDISQQQAKDNSHPSQQQVEQNSIPWKRQDDDNSNPSCQQDEDNSELTQEFESNFELNKICITVDEVHACDVEPVVHEVEEKTSNNDSDTSDGYAQPCPDGTFNVKW